jgi:hypothetical protein
LPQPLINRAVIWRARGNFDRAIANTSEAIQLANALDGEGVNSPFSAALSRHIGRPRLEEQQMPTLMRAGVFAAAKSKQVSRSNSSLLGEVFRAGWQSIEFCNPRAFRLTDIAMVHWRDARIVGRNMLTRRH